MTDTQNQPTADDVATADPIEPTVDAPQADEAVEDQPTEGKAGREAAKYRRQLRDTEQQLEQAQAALDTARSTALDLLLSKGTKIPSENGRYDRNVTLDDPADLFDLGYVTREECFNPDGSINHDRIREAVTTMHTERPRFFNNKNSMYLPNIGKTPEVNLKGAFQEAFSPKNSL